MKQLKILSGLFVAFALFSCNKSELNIRQATVNRDCTGTYLRWENEDYRVCNEEQLQNYSDGAVVQAEFHRIPICASGGTKVVCYLYHPFKYDVTVTRVE